MLHVAMLEGGNTCVLCSGCFSLEKIDSISN